jgi:mutator protein MutT
MLMALKCMPAACGVLGAGQAEREKAFTPALPVDKLVAMKPIDHFQFCPRCGQHQLERPAGASFRCARCGFLYYFNPAISASAFVQDESERTLFIRRAKDPAKGKLAIPGGFVDAGETAEGAVCREVREEVNLGLTALEYFYSAPNEYPYQGITYSVLDLFFIARAEGADGTAALDGVESYDWLRAAEVDSEEIAFRSMREAFLRFVSSRS